MERWSIMTSYNVTGYNTILKGNINCPQWHYHDERGGRVAKHTRSGHAYILLRIPCPLAGEFYMKQHIILQTQRSPQTQVIEHGNIR